MHYMFIKTMEIKHKRLDDVKVFWSFITERERDQQDTTTKLIYVGGLAKEFSLQVLIFGNNNTRIK